MPQPGHWVHSLVQAVIFTPVLNRVRCVGARPIGRVSFVCSTEPASRTRLRSVVTMRSFPDSGPPFCSGARSPRSRYGEGSLRVVASMTPCLE